MENTVVFPNLKVFYSDDYSHAYCKQEMRKYFFAEKPQMKMNVLKKETWINNSYLIKQSLGYFCKQGILPALHGGSLEITHTV